MLKFLEDRLATFSSFLTVPWFLTLCRFNRPDLDFKDFWPEPSCVYVEKVLSKFFIYGPQKFSNVYFAIVATDKFPIVQ